MRLVAPIRWTLLMAAAVLLGIAKPSGQGLGFGAPQPLITAHAITGLQVDYTAGRIASGGTVNNITAGNVTATDAMTNCAAPTYPSCNFLYWPGSGNALSTTTTLSTAYASGNVVLAFVTTSGGNITAITPATSNVPRTPSIAGYWVPPGACNQAVSGNATGTNGLTVIGASNTPVVQSSTSGTGTNTHTYLCNISPPLRPSSIVDVTFLYGTSTALGTQAAVLASGTMNGSIVLASITYPASGASETPSSVTPTRADSGTLTITPTVGTFNSGTTTTGAFYSLKFTPAASIAVTADLVQLLLTVTLQAQAATATITNSPGVYVRYTR